MTSIRILVVEDHQIVRQGLVALLNVAEGVEVVGQAADGTQAVKEFETHLPDVTLIDLRLPKMSGVEVIQRVRGNYPQARFIVLTTFDGDEDIYRALQAGARAYLLKGMTVEVLISTIRSVHAGQVHHPSGNCPEACRTYGNRATDAARTGSAGADCARERATRRLALCWIFQKRQ